jgi:long-subunit fatty acid transport protein
VRAPFRVHAALFVGLSLGSAAAASAQIGVSFNRTGSGARAAGMANAFIAISDDGTAASWNPSGLAQLRKPELSIVSTTSGDSASVSGFRTRDDLASFSSAQSTYRGTYPDFASLAVPVTLWKTPVTFQAAWRRMYSLDYRERLSVTRVPLTSSAPPPFRFESDSDVLGSVDLFSAAAAVKLTGHVSVGGSYNFWRGDWDEAHLRSATPLEAPAVTEFVSVSQTSRVRGESFMLGAMLTYPRFSVGLVYLNPLVSDFDTSARGVTSVTEGDITQVLDGELHFPRAFGIGGAWRPASRWTVALDFTWDDWSETFLDTPTTGRIGLFDNVPLELSASRDTWSMNAGAERLFAGEGFVVPLRFGLAWEPQGARDPYTRDSVDFVLVALGTGYNTNSLKFDAAFQYRWASFESGAEFGPSEASPLLPSAVGERRNSQWRLKLSLILRITDTDKLKRGLGKIFG